MIQLSIVAKLWSQTTFERTYGGKYYDAGYEVLETADDGYIIVGTTKSFSNDTTDAYVIRTDPSGDTLWTKIYGGDLRDSGIAIAPASDSGYVLAVASNSIHPGNYDIYIVKIDDMGDTLWTKTYGGPDTDYGHSLQSTTDGGYIALAHTLSFGMGSLDFYLLRLDQNGDSLWTKTYGGTESDWGSSVQQTSDGGFILTGDTYSFGDPKGDIYMIKTNADGDTMWTRTYGGTDYDRAYHVIQTNDKGYLIGGITGSFGEADRNGYIIKTDESGDTLWTKILGDQYTSSIDFMQQTSDGNYIAVGGINTIESKSDVYLVKLNSVGTVLWIRLFGGVESDWGNCVQETADGGFIIVGNSESFAVNQDDDVYLIKTDGSGNLTSIKSSGSGKRPEAITLLTNYPNPFNSSTKISFVLPKADFTTIKIYNLLGKEIKTILNKHMAAGQHELIWNGENLSSGIYLCRLISGNFIGTQKLLYQK